MQANLLPLNQMKFAIQPVRTVIYICSDLHFPNFKEMFYNQNFCLALHHLDSLGMQVPQASRIPFHIHVLEIVNLYLMFD